MFSVNQLLLHDYPSVFITSLFLSVTFAYISVVMHLHDTTCHPLIYFFCKSDSKQPYQQAVLSTELSLINIFLVLLELILFSFFKQCTHVHSGAEAPCSILVNMM